MSEGGYNRAPKFPLPNNWQFLLRYSQLVERRCNRMYATLLTLGKNGSWGYL